MTTREAYERYILELQANGTTDNIQSNRERFAVNYNKAQNRLVEWLIERRDNADNRYVQLLKKIDVPLSKISTEDNKEIFGLKEDHFDFINLNAYGKKGNCTNQEFFLTEIKGENLNSLLSDANTRPSFKYRESFYLINSDSITLFTDNFTFEKAQISYYRYPRQVRVENPDNPESQLENIELEFDDKVINRIITLAASVHSMNANDQKFQALKQEALTKT